MERTSTVPVELVDGGGTTRAELVLHDPAATVGDLAAALGWPCDEVVIDGGRPAPETPLAAAGLGPAARVVRGGSAPAGSTAPLPPPPEHDPEPVAVVEVVAGPDAGRRWALPPGAHLLGRSRGAELRLGAGVAAVQAAVAVAPDGTVTVEDLTTTPPRAGKAPVPTVDGLVPAGDALLRIGRPAVVAAGAGPAGPPGADGRVVIRRAVRPAPPPAAAPLVLPAPPAAVAPPPVPPLGPVVASVLVAAVVAVVMGQPLLLLLGLGGLLGLAVPAAAGRLRHRRGERRRRGTAASLLVAASRLLADDTRARAADRWLRLPGLAGALVSVERLDLWSRRADDPAAWQVVLGVGDVEAPPLVSGPVPEALWAAAEAASTLSGVPVTATLGPGDVLGVTGDAAAAAALVRALLLQLAAATGPADLVIAAHAPAPWSWLAWLPHSAGPAGSLAATGATPAWADDLTAAADGRHLVVLVVGGDALVSPAHPVRQVLDARPAAVVVLAPAVADLPPSCTAVVRVDARSCATVGAGDGLPRRITVAGAAREVAEAAARRLARTVDPEAACHQIDLPGVVELARLLGPDALDPDTLAASWDAAGGDPPARTPLGVTTSGPLTVDLAHDGPHVLVAGTTGSGKSELLRTLVAGLAVACPPEALQLVLVDYKGGSAFDACARLPHVAGVVTDLDEGLAERALRGLDAELRQRESVLRTTGAADLAGHRRRGGEPLPRLVVVVDELATLVADLPGFVGSLVDVARRGRSLGVHLVLATQRPAGAVSADVRANTNLRLALRVQDPADSVDVVGVADAARLPRRRPGRVVVRFGDGEVVEAQAASTGSPVPTFPAPPVEVVTGPAHGGVARPRTLDVLVDACVAAAARRPAAPGPAPAPWLAPLPARLGPDDVPAAALGLLDDPDARTQAPVSWAPAAGHLLVSGALGSGATTTLLRAAQAVTAGRRPAEIHLHAVDLGGGGLAAGLADCKHAGAVLAASDGERHVRLVHHLAAELERRRSGATGPQIVVVVDDLPAWRRTIGERAGLAWLEQLDAVLAGGPAVGIVSAASASQPSVFPPAVVAGAAMRLVLRPADPGDVLAAGVPPALATALPAGRAVLAGTAQLLQVAPPGPWPAAPRSRGAAPRLEALPRCVGWHAVARAATAPAGGWALPLGLDAEALAPIVLPMAPGDHLLIGGPSRSGRSTALALVAAAVEAAGGRACSVDPRHPLAPGADPPPGAVVLVDDAERIDDTTGALAALVARHDLTVVAAGRTDALRGAYGHWTQPLRRRRNGLLLRPDGDVDGDLFGIVVPRLAHLPRAPGRGLLVTGGEVRALQLALPPEGAAALRPVAAPRSRPRSARVPPP